MAGIVAYGSVGGDLGVWGPIAVALLLALAALARPSALALALAVAAAGAAGFAVREAAPAPELPATSSLFEGVVARIPDEDGRGRAVLVDVDGGVRVRVFERGATGAPLLPGDRVRFAGRPRAPSGFATEGALDRERILRGRGIDAEVTARLVRLPSVPGPSVWRVAGWLRGRAEVAFAAASGGDGGALLAALVLGQRRDVPEELEAAFRDAGVAHVLSVSGLHLAAAALFAFLIARRIGLASSWLTTRLPADRAAALLALPAAAGYTLITGAEIATLRALVCVTVVLGGKALGRRGDGLTALAVSSLLLLAHAPAALFEPSFQLSFAAAAALAALAGRPSAGRGRVTQMLLVSAAATLATSPLTALHFGAVQPGGVLANLVVVPLAELIVLPLGLVGALLGIIHPGAGAAFVALGGLAASGLALLVEGLARVLPSFTVPPPRPHELALMAVVVVALLRRRVRVAAVAAIACAVAYALSYLPPSELRATFVDVGQGDAALVETPAGERWLIDAGGRLFGDGPDPGELSLRPFLLARRVPRLDVVVLSHAHPDHYGGLSALIATVPIRELWLSGDEPGDPRWEQLLARLAVRGTLVRHVRAGDGRRAGDARLDVLYPAAPDGARSVNDNSLVVRVGYAGRSLLMTGDLEAEGEAAAVAAGLGHSDVVKVPHHGSRTSSTPAFARATSPSLAVISLGRDNRFGFPAPSVVETWRAAGAEVLRTDERGSITVTVEPSGHLTWHARR
jgi:competence protein ComEC